MSSNGAKDIRIDPHTLQRMPKRGVAEAEVFDVLLSGKSFAAKHGRLGKFKVFPFHAHFEGIYYQQKRVEVVYVEENGIFVTVTVFAYYGKWED